MYHITVTIAILTNIQDNKIISKLLSGRNSANNNYKYFSKLKILLSLIYLMIVPAMLLAEETSPNCNGFLYRTKLDNVPVFRHPDMRSKVITTLGQGQKVCYVGEDKSFAIIDWTENYKNNGPLPLDKLENKDPLVYIKRSALWAPPNHSPTKEKSLNVGIPGIINTAKRYFYYNRSGGVPEDGLAPYKPLINLFKKETYDDLLENTKDKQSCSKRDCRKTVP